MSKGTSKGTDPSLRQYVLVSQHESQHERRVEVWTRGPDGAWKGVVCRDGESADLVSIGARLDVRELYDAAAPT